MGSQHVCLSGVTWAESQDPEALDAHLRRLEAHKVSLLDRRRHCTSLEVKAELEGHRAPQRATELKETGVESPIRPETPERNIITMFLVGSVLLLS